MASSDFRYETKFGEARQLIFSLIDAGAQDFENTPVVHVAGDTQISKDGGAFVNTTNGFVHVGNGVYALTLTATETQAARIAITVIDSAVKAWEDKFLYIETYGNASSQHFFDRDSQKVILADSVTHGGANTVLELDRLKATSTVSGEAAIQATGLDAGAGIEATGGSSGGHGVEATGGDASALAAGHGISSQGGNNTGGLNGGHGLHGRGGTSSGTDGVGIRAEAQDAGHGFHATSVSGQAMRVTSATGNAIFAETAFGGTAVIIDGQVNGLDIKGQGGPALVCTSTGSNGEGAKFQGDGSGAGFLATGGLTGDGMRLVGQGGGDDLDADITGNLSGSVGSLTGHTNQTGDSFARLGAPAGASVSADIAAIKAETASILVDTGITLDNHLTDIKGTGFVKDTHSLTNIEGFVDLIDDGTSGLTRIAVDVAAVLVDTAQIGTAGVGLTDLGGMSIGMKAEVNAEALDVINTDTFTEPAQGTPGVSASLVDKIGFLYKAWRNRTTQDATTYKLHNDDGTTVDHKATVSDDGTVFDRGEVATGP